MSQHEEDIKKPGQERNEGDKPTTDPEAEAQAATDEAAAAEIQDALSIDTNVEQNEGVPVTEDPLQELDEVNQFFHRGTIGGIRFEVIDSGGMILRFPDVEGCNDAVNFGHFSEDVSMAVLGKAIEMAQAGSTAGDIFKFVTEEYDQYDREKRARWDAEKAAEDAAADSDPEYYSKKYELEEQELAAIQRENKRLEEIRRRNQEGELTEDEQATLERLVTQLEDQLAELIAHEKITDDYLAASDFTGRVIDQQFGTMRDGPKGYREFQAWADERRAEVAEARAKERALEVQIYGEDLDEMERKIESAEESNDKLAIRKLYRDKHWGSKHKELNRKLYGTVKQLYEVGYWAYEDHDNYREHARKKKNYIIQGY